MLFAFAESEEPSRRFEGQLSPAKQLVYYALGVGLLCWVAVWNGYPLVFPDSGTYIRAVIQLHNPAVRPIYYSIFIALFHWGLSLWPVVIAQAFIATWVVGEAFAVLVPNSRLWQRLCVLAFLSVATAQPWAVSEIMPDFFTPLLVVALFLVVVKYDRLRRSSRLGLLALLCVMQASHYTHVALAIGIFATIAFFAFVMHRRISLAGFSLAATTTALAVAAIITVNFVERREVVFAPWRGLVLLGRLMEYGTAQDYLVRTCPTHNYRICRYVGRLPHNVSQFLYSDNSVLTRLGGGENYRDEASSLSHDILWDAPGRHAMLAAEATADQFLDFPTGNGNDVQGPEQEVTEMIYRYFSYDAPFYRASRQQTGQLHRDEFNALHVPVGFALLVANFMLLIFSLVHRRNDDSLLLLVIIAALIGNAFLCGAFSSPQGRYQSRMIPLLMIGLLPLMAQSGWPRNTKSQVAT